MSTKTLMTVEEFAEMSAAETGDYELIEGVPIPLPSASPLHAKIRQNIERRLASCFDQNPAGAVLSEVDCRISGNTVRRPDCAVFLGNRLKGVDPKKIPLPFAPEIAVEVLSPSESVIEVHRKTLEYLAAGTVEVWQLDQDKGEVFVQTSSGIRLPRNEDLIESPLLPGFSASVAILLTGI